MPTYTPMESSENKLSYRDPVWIPETAAEVQRVIRKLKPGTVGRILRRLAKGAGFKSSHS